MPISSRAGTIGSAQGSGIRGLGLNLAVGQLSCQAELYIDRGEREENKSIFDQLIAHRAQIETGFAFPIEWERLDHRRACRIKSVIAHGGYRSPDANWPALQQALVDRITLLEKALRPFLDTLQI